jgi:hypothetical protein
MQERPWPADVTSIAGRRGLHIQSVTFDNEIFESGDSLRLNRLKKFTYRQFLRPYPQNHPQADDHLENMNGKPLTHATRLLNRIRS